MGAYMCYNMLEDLNAWEPEEMFIQKMMRRSDECGGPKLTFTVAAAPSHDPTGASVSLYTPSADANTLWVQKLGKERGLAPQRSHIDDYIEDGAGFEKSQRWDHWRCKVVHAEENGSLMQQSCLLKIARQRERRTMSDVMHECNDARVAASYAHEFNTHILGMMGGDTESAPHVRICAPIGCKVTHSPVPSCFSIGEAAVLLPYWSGGTTRFVVDGNDPFLEIPHAFFHYVVWRSAGLDWVQDLQGLQDEETGSVVLVNPRLLRPNQDACVTPDLFDRLHPFCGPLCRSFDPERRSRPARVSCEVHGPCGLGVAPCNRP